MQLAKAKFSRANRAWWIAPIVPVMMLALSIASPVALAEAGAAIGADLQGAAAVANAVAPMEEANAEAQSDIAVAHINSNMAQSLANTTSATDEYLSNDNAKAALADTYAAAAINATNQRYATLNLGMQLSAMDAIRQTQDKLNQEKMMDDYIENTERIQLAQQEGAMNVALARYALKFQVTMAGLFRNFTNSSTARDRLTITRTLFGGQPNSSSINGADASGGQGNADPSKRLLSSVASRGVASVQSGASWGAPPSGSAAMAYLTSENQTARGSTLASRALVRGRTQAARVASPPAETNDMAPSDSATDAPVLRRTHKGVRATPSPAAVSRARGGVREITAYDGQ